MRERDHIKDIKDDVGVELLWVGGRHLSEKGDPTHRAKGSISEEAFALSELGVDPANREPGSTEQVRFAR